MYSGGRYKAILVEKDSYLLELARYVVLKPFRAGMIKEVGEWPWSSYPAMIGTALAAGLVTTGLAAGTIRSAARTGAGEVCGFRACRGRIAKSVE